MRFSASRSVTPADWPRTKLPPEANRPHLHVLFKIGDHFSPNATHTSGATLRFGSPSRWYIIMLLPTYVVASPEDLRTSCPAVWGGIPVRRTRSKACRTAKAHSKREAAEPRQHPPGVPVHDGHRVDEPPGHLTAAVPRGVQVLPVDPTPQQRFARNVWQQVEGKLGRSHRIHGARRYRRVLSRRPRLATEYETQTFEQVHHPVFDLVPKSDVCVLDVGAGSGRDAVWWKHDDQYPQGTTSFRTSHDTSLSSGGRRVGQTLWPANGPQRSIC